MKATLKLSNGTLVTIEGGADDVGALLGRFDGKGDGVRANKSAPREASGGDGEAGIDVTAIVNLVKDCEEAEAIEARILSQRSMLHRVLLPLYVAGKHLGSLVALTSGEISRITVELGVPVSQPNTSSTLSGSASRFVMGDRRRVRGQAVRYRLSRRGVELMESVIRGGPVP